MPGPTDDVLRRWEETVAQIKSIVHGLVSALNDRRCTMDSPEIFNSYDRDFRAEKSPYFFDQSEPTLAGYVAGVNEITSLHPDWFVRMVQLDVSYLDETHADAIGQLEVHNVPVGTRRQVMSKFRFHEKQGKWLCYTTEAIGGFMPDASGGTAGSAGAVPGI